MNLNKNLLLPHKWQIVGWWLLAAAVILAVVLIVGDISGVLHNVPTLLTWILAYLGVLLVCLSRERVDDEYISAIRGRIVCILVCVAVIAKVLYFTIFLTCVCIYQFIPTMSYLGLFSYAYNPLSLMVIYIIAFKLTLFIQNRRIGRYAEK